jgi:general stress protein YciG
MSKNKNAVALGKKGGAARAKAITPERRREIARKAAQARWEKQRARESIDSS